MFLTRRYYGDQIEEIEMDWACDTRGREEISVKERGPLP
jgi:hypothetical protein